MERLRKITVVLLTIVLMQSLFVGSALAIAGQDKDNPGKGNKIHQFKYIDPVTAVADMSPGWNLGNQLDAVPTEGSWNNPVLQEHALDGIKEAGFKSIRIPVTWTHHMGPAPDYIVDQAWMDRVAEVVDWALERDFYVVLNVHHDSVHWASMDHVEGREEIKDKMDKLWRQIAEQFKNRSEKLMFEVLNEPYAEGSDPDHLADVAAQYNDINQRVLNVIRSTGGHNKQRLVVLPGLWTSIDKTIEYFETPDDPNIILTVHNYDPWDFAANAWGRTNWGTTEERQYFDDLFKRLYDKFVVNGLPVIIGEFGGGTETRSRWVYHDTFVRSAYKYGMAPMLWDNGVGVYDRVNQVWLDPIVKDIIVNAAKGIPNSLVDKASLYFQAGEAVTEDRSVQIEMRGNTLLGIYNNGHPLVEGADYTFDGSTVIFKAAFLANALTKLGINASLELKFSAGADQLVRLIQYRTPELGETTITIDRSKGDVTEDLAIPTNFNGTTLATVQAVYSNIYHPSVPNLLLPVKDDWTVWLTSDRYGRLNQGDFWSDAGHVYISRNILNMLTADTTLTFEFWPREQNVNVVVQIKVVN
jgi:endoglucanase